MGLQVIGERTLVFQLIDGCPCKACADKVKKHLKRINGIGFIDCDADEGKITIKGTNLNPIMVISELKTIKKNAKLVTEENSKKNQIGEQQDVIHPTEALTEEAVTVVAYPKMVISELNMIKKDAKLFMEENSKIDQKEEKQYVIHHTEALTEEADNKSQMGLQVIGERTLVFLLIDGCPCKACAEEVQRHLERINGIGFVDFDADERKITIKGTKLDPNMVISKLKMIKKDAKLLTEENSEIDQKVEKQDVSHLTKALTEEAVLGKLALQISQHFHSKHDHEHELELKNYNKRFTCNGCKKEGIRSRYRCKHCDYELHRDCMNPEPTISHELCEGLIFEFSRDKPLPTCGDSRCSDHAQMCQACGTPILGYAYHSKTKGLSLHPSCVKLEAKLCTHDSTFTLKKKAPYNCIWCRDKSERGTDYGWAYVSEDNKCHFHVNCIAKIAYEAWDKRSIESDDDAYRVVLKERLNLGLIKHPKRNVWHKGSKILKTIILFARAVIGIVLGDPTVILASMLVELLKKG